MILISYCYLSEENHEELLKKNLFRFSANYQKKIQSFKKWQDAQLSLLGRMLLFNGINEFTKKKYSDEDIRYTIFNKPYFKDSLIHFNVSHSGNIVICAISDEAEIGIDIEKIVHIDINDFKTQMTDDEWFGVVSSNNEIMSFYDFWTKKEAVVKAYGQGLGLSLKSFEIINNKTSIKNEIFELKEIKFDDTYKCYLSQKCIKNKTIEDQKIKIKLLKNIKNEILY